LMAALNPSSSPSDFKPADTLSLSLRPRLVELQQQQQQQPTRRQLQI
jgi:hypothetical protein